MKFNQRGLRPAALKNRPSAGIPENEYIPESPQMNFLYAANDFQILRIGFMATCWMVGRQRLQSGSERD